MKICMQSLATSKIYPMKEAYRKIKEAGFDAIDWNIDTAWNYKKVCASPELSGLCIFEKSLPEIMEYYAEELEAIREAGLTISQAHAPYRSNDPERPEVLDYSISLFKNIVLFCNEVGCKNLVIHGISMAEYDPDLTLERYEADNMKLYSSLIPELRQTNVTVCLENLFCTNYISKGFCEGVCSNPDIAVKWIDRLNEMAGKECFGLCLDVGHLNLLRKSFRQYIPTLGKRIKALHIHDNNQDADSHIMPYAGNVPWEDFLTELNAVGYNGDISFETFSQIKSRRVPIELVPTFLRAMAEIGDYFRSRIEGKIVK